MIIYLSSSNNSPDIVAVELVLRYLQRQVVLKESLNRRYLYLNEQAHDLNEVFNQLKGTIFSHLHSDHFFQNNSIEDRLTEEAAIRVCTRTLSLICDYYRWVHEGQRNPYWVIINPVRKMQHHLWARGIEEQLQKEILNLKNIRTTVCDIFELMTSTLNKHPSFLVRAVIYSYLQHISSPVNQKYFEPIIDILNDYIELNHFVIRYYQVLIIKVL
jgi:hypothetical protein